eukprot:TRINITY_DN2444_c0_g1_i1.p1 TRINITY_DN2444_c0_g1~~TRINITY_DN2444_c0_g1_i1.p1  ORF type:complete len:463 (+),score=81.30 TRINITY_DN2444_c0_g1_i1:240-1628(+)
MLNINLFIALFCIYVHNTVADYSIQMWPMVPYSGSIQLQETINFTFPLDVSTDYSVNFAIEGQAFLSLSPIQVGQQTFFRSTGQTWSMSQPANWALVSTTPCSNDVAGQIALVELMCASDVCNFTMELVTTSNLLSDESDATISLSSGAKFISFPISSSDHPLVITMSANQPSSLTWGCGQATDSMCGDVLLHGDEGRLPVFTSISEPDWFSSASYISQYVIRKPIAGVVYTLYASSDPASNMINQINISRSYTCSDDCIGYGVCLPPSSTSSSDGTCLCSLVGNVTGLQCSQVSLGKSEVKVNDVVAGTLDYLEVTSYSFIVPPDSSSVYEIHLVSAAEYYLGLNCTGKDRSCYTQTMNDVGAGAMKSICPYDHGLWSLTLINRAMPSTYKISLLTSELVVNQIAYNKMLYTEKSENTFIIVADRYMCNPSLTFIGTTTGEKNSRCRYWLHLCFCEYNCYF